MIKNVNIFGEGFDQPVYNQMRAAMEIPVAVRGALMPDAHPGYSVPIGAVVGLRDAISPAFVGVDIGCRMHASLYFVDPDIVEKTKPYILDTILSVTSFGVGSTTENAQHSVMHNPLWDSDEFLSGLKSQAQSQLGSSGGGNHFAAFMLDAERGVGAFITHSGSRGTGFKTANHYIKKSDEAVDGMGIPKGYGWLMADSEEGQAYIKSMNLMLDYARANHEVIHRRFADIFGSPHATYQNHHNYASLEEIDGEMLWVHRKGATPARSDNFSIIPGSMATPTYFVRGKNNPDSLYSASHGAGRVSSRGDARRNFDEELYKLVLEDEGILTAGVSPDESFMAYKDIEEVMKSQEDCVEVIYKMMPRVEVMGGRDED